MSRLRFTKVATPSTPSANTVEIFVDTADKLTKQIDDAGLVTPLALSYTPVPPTRTVNGHALSADVTVTPGDVANILYAASDASTITFDIDANGALQTVTLGGNRTLALTISANRVFSLILKQDGTGSRLVTWFSGISWAGGVAPTLTTTLNKSDQFVFVRTGSGAYLGFVVGQNI